MIDSSTFAKPALTALALILALGTTGCTKKSFYPYPIPTGYHYNADKYGYGAYHKTDETEDREEKTAEPQDLKATDTQENDFHYALEDEDMAGWDYESASMDDRADDTLIDDTEMDDESMFAEETVIDRDASPAAWQSAADDLIQQMLNNLGTPAETIYLTPEEPGNPYNRDFSPALRNALETEGLEVSPVQGGGPFALTYAIIDDGYDSSRLRLKIRLSASYKVATEETGLYTIGEDTPDQKPATMDRRSGITPDNSDDAPVSLNPYAP